MLLNLRAQGRQQEGSRVCGIANSGPSAAARISTVARGFGASGADQRVHEHSAVHLGYCISDPTNATNYQYLVYKYHPLRFPIVSSKREP
jgi:hypothetical protein